MQVAMPASADTEGGKRQEASGTAPQQTASISTERVDTEFWDSENDEEQPLRASSPTKTPSEEQSGSEENSPGSLLFISPLKSLWSLIWDSGMTCMGVSAAIQSLSALLVKVTDSRVPVFEIVVVRSVICMGFTFWLARMQGITNIFGSMKYIVPLFIRGLAGAVSMSVYYYAIFKLPLSDTVILFFTHPAMIIVLAWLVRGEVVRWTGIVGILASLIGTVVVSQPPFLLGGGDWSPDHLHGVIASLLAAFLAAVAFISIRYIPKSEPSICVAAWFHFMGIVTAGLPLAFGFPSWPVLPSVLDSLILFGVGVCSFTSHIFIARSLQIEIAAKASAGGYLQVVFAYIYGLAILGEGIKLSSVVGSLVICIGVIATSLPSKKQAEQVLPVTVEKDVQDNLEENELVPFTETCIESDATAKVMILGSQSEKV